MTIILQIHDILDNFKLNFVLKRYVMIFKYLLQLLVEIFQLKSFPSVTLTLLITTNVHRQLIQLKIHISSTFNVCMMWTRRKFFIHLCVYTINFNALDINCKRMSRVDIHYEHAMIFLWCSIYMCGQRTLRYFATYLINLIQTIYQILK